MLIQVPARPPTDRQWAICIFDDLLEYAGPVSQMLFSQERLSFLAKQRLEIKSFINLSFSCNKADRLIRSNDWINLIYRSVEQI